MKLLITGATGLIGNELVALLLKNNHTVHYLTTSQSKINNKPNYFGFYWNPQESKIDENCIEGVDVIVHLAGASISKRWTNSYKQELIESRVLSANLLFNLLKKTPNQVKHYISASGTAIYPDSYDVIYDETSKQVDTSFLGHVVVKWEESADQFKLLNLKVTKLRTGVVFSEKGGALLEMIKPIKMYFGSGFGSGNQMQSWIHLTDIANLYYFVIQNQIEGILNAVAPEYITNQGLTKALAKHLKRPLFLPNVPQFVMKLILGEMSILLFNNKKILPKKALSSGFQFQFDTVEKALQNIIK
ncbi:TIGR01777 family oxidoreductase [Flavobacterium sp. SUN052]|uniref:TIGR01777 family oxidoreductase n=1 Tax=Flavobacterium sp. SUN052 TaxID=3002441 RepID=UPI00237D412A|nr:TIGR01777 family oxidoreductase [Flavobacterium sp. SUN052]MEC4003962.1 TIGR01777 family oxidoreductase [Flavobacterium sp. SUN052]